MRYPEFLEQHGILSTLAESGYTGGIVRECAANYADTKGNGKGIVGHKESASTSRSIIMSLITWDASLSVGVPELDIQHKKLIGMINDLHNAMASGQGKDILSRLLSGVITYTCVHFRNEEKLMQAANYPDYAAHKREHDELTAKAEALKNRFDSGQTMITIDVMNFLRDWLKQHILGTDRKYTPYLNR